jgi:hypothetical protein
MTSFQIDDYDEAVALYRLLLSYKYAPNPLHREIFGSPLIAAIHTRLAKTLNAMEIERKRPENQWTPKLVLESTVWNLLVANTIEMDGGKGWKRLSTAEKRQMAEIVLSPFSYDDAALHLFVQQVDDRFADQLS